ncbi:MAG: hypothetical protein II942_01825 [Alphaproteobacteria bacterium]|nr:hypothetical protein [Alphaproteobacteria bacterium]
MFYLTAFLTMLISLMIYMLDLVPNRLKHDTRGAEGYITSFVNQHQAAKDYMNYWLGRLNPGRDDGAYGRGCLAVDGNLNENVSGQKCDNMAGMSFPGFDLAHTLPKALRPLDQINDGSEYYMDSESGASALVFNPQNDDFDGSYISALLCVNEDNEAVLAPCFLRQYRAPNGALHSEVGVCSDLTAGATYDGHTCRMVRNPHAKVYALTYSDGVWFATWWPDNTNRMKRYALWRRAIANRTHKSHGCGTLREAPSGHKWKYDRTRMRNRVEAATAALGGTHDYCIDNGQECVRVVPKAIQTFLEDLVMKRSAEGRGVDIADPGNESVQNPGHWSLDLMLLCMTDLSDNSQLYTSPTYHFDGIDKLALGGPAIIPDNGDWYWVSTVDTDGPAVICLPGAHPEDCDPIPSGTSRACFVSDANGCNRGGMIGLRGGWIMPFGYTNGDFTLTIVMKADENQEDWVIGDNTVENVYDAGSNPSPVPFGFKWNPDHSFSFFPAPGRMVTSTDESWLRELHSWTIRRKNNQMYLYLDNFQLSKDDVEHWPAATQAKWDEKIKFTGANSSVFIGDIRYYNRALTNREIKRNYELDAKRYGIRRQCVGANCGGGGGATPIPDDDN